MSATMVEAVNIALIGSVPKAWLEKDLQVLVESSKSLRRGMVVDGKLGNHVILFTSSIYKSDQLLLCHSRDPEHTLSPLLQNRNGGNSCII
eukprot:scaffold5601_cov77-Cylindrotheca_fusiformis.AAC.2